MNKLPAILAAVVMLGSLSAAAQADGPRYRDGHRYVERDYYDEARDYRRDARRAHRRAHRLGHRHHHRHGHRHAHRHHRAQHRHWHRDYRVLHHPRGHRCRIGRRHYHDGVAFYGDLETVVLGAVAYGLVREVFD